MDPHQVALHVPLPEDDDLLPPPVTRSMLDSGFNSPRDSYALSQGQETHPPSSTNLVGHGSSVGSNREKEAAAFAEKSDKRLAGGRKRLLLLGGLVAFVVVVLAVILPVYFVVIRPKQHHSNAAAAAGTQAPPGSTTIPGKNPTGGSPTSPITGGDGSVVTAADGSTFTYHNSFGGFWISDPSDPFSNAAQPQSWVPALNKSWDFSKDLIHGVNLGGWFVPEPFIVPALFEKYQNATPGATDEWTLSQAMTADTSPGGGLNQLETHYQTFITEKDFAEIAGAGLNWIRLPIPFWCVDKWNDEPFLAKVSWKYILQAFEWARKYGLRIYLDLHTVPGSQNGFNHSGKGGQINFLNGVMGLANAERTLGYIRTIVEFIAQKEYTDLIPIFGIVNEPLLHTIGKDTLTSFYLDAHNMMRSITGTGAGNGPYISIHDGFQSVSSWANFLPGSDRIILDTHPYFAFDGSPNTQPLSDYATMPCTSWADNINASQTAFGVTVAGEFSNAVNDCGKWVRGVGNQASYGGDCSFWEDATQWNATVISGVKQFAMSSMDALQNYFFWTWKIGNSSVTNTVLSPLWSYQYGLQNGFIPKDPREAYGACSSLGVQQDDPFTGTYSSWQTGGAGAGSIAPSATAAAPWPPVSIAGVDQVTLLPTYTNTAPVETLPTPTFAVTTAGQTSTITAGDGWVDPQDTQGGVTQVAGCTYPDAWAAASLDVPPAACTGPAVKREVPEPLITQAPRR